MSELLPGKQYEMPLPPDRFEVLSRMAKFGKQVVARLVDLEDVKMDIKTNRQLWLAQYLTGIQCAMELTVKDMIDAGFPTGNYQDASNPVQKAIVWARRCGVRFTESGGRRSRVLRVNPLNEPKLIYYGALFSPIRLSELDDDENVTRWKEEPNDYELPNLTLCLPIEIAQKAACRGLAGALHLAEDVYTRSLAVEVCTSCRVQQACFDYAKNSGVAYGVWGGNDFGAEESDSDEQEL